MLFAQASEGFGGVDVVVHTPGRVTKTPFAEISDDEFEASVSPTCVQPSSSFASRRAGCEVEDNVTITTSITGANRSTGYSIYAGHKPPPNTTFAGSPRSSEPVASPSTRWDPVHNLALLLCRRKRAVLPGCFEDERCWAVRRVERDSSSGGLPLARPMPSGSPRPIHSHQRWDDCLAFEASSAAYAIARCASASAGASKRRVPGKCGMSSRMEQRFMGPSVGCLTRNGRSAARGWSAADSRGA